MCLTVVSLGCVSSFPCPWRVAARRFRCRLRESTFVVNRKQIHYTAKWFIAPVNDTRGFIRLHSLHSLIKQCRDSMYWPYKEGEGKRQKKIGGEGRKKMFRFYFKIHEILWTVLWFSRLASFLVFWSREKLKKNTRRFNTRHLPAFISRQFCTSLHTLVILYLCFLLPVAVIINSSIPHQQLPNRKWSKAIASEEISAHTAVFGVKTSSITR